MTNPDAPVSESDIAHYFQLLLGRDPDAPGLEWYRDRAREGLTHYQLYRDLTSSDEWRAQPLAARQQVRVGLMRDFGRLQELLDELSWFHSVALPDDGLETRGHKPAEVLQREAELVFPADLAGKRVLDIGAWDGFFSFEAERRGAQSVLSTDHFSWSGPGWGSKAGYDLLHAARGSQAQSRDVDVFQLDPQELGTFDLVLFLGVLYHLKDPLGGLERAAAMSGEQLVVETETTHNFSEQPLMRYYSGDEMNADDTNYWAPNLACLRAMLTDLGFSRISATPNFDYEHSHTPEDGERLFRYIIHAHR